MSKRRKRLTPSQKVLRVLVFVLLPCIIVGVAGVGIYAALNPGGDSSEDIAQESSRELGSDAQHSQSGSSETSEGSSLSQEEKDFLEWMGQKPNQENVTALLIGMDLEEVHTDVIMLCNFNKETRTTSIISIPRDTYIKLTDEEYKELRKLNKYAYREMKLTELHAFAYGKDATKWTVNMVEKILDIDVDFYVSVNFEGFRQVVDAIGGVEFDVPKTITTWNDDYQRNVTVEAGPQVLNGEQAEAVVRHRKTYSEADLQRVQIQQGFMKAAAKQLLQGKNILKIPELIRICYKYVNTDLGVGDILKYAAIAGDVDLDNLVTGTLPGGTKDVGDRNYFVMDSAKTKELMASIFNPSKYQEWQQQNSSDSADSSEDSRVR